MANIILTFLKSFLDKFQPVEIELELEDHIFRYNKTTKTLKILKKSELTELESHPDTDLVWKHDDLSKRSTFEFDSADGRPINPF